MFIILLAIYAIIAGLDFWYLYKIQKKNIAELNEEYKERNISFDISYFELLLQAILWPFFGLWILLLTINNK